MQIMNIDPPTRFWKWHPVDRTEPPPVRLTAPHARDAPPSQAEEMSPEGRYAPENRLTALDHPLLPTSPSTLAPSRAKNPGTT
jgi:hypothetical protein